MKTGRAAYKQQLLYSNTKKNIVKTNFVFVLYVFGINESKTKKKSNKYFLAACNFLLLFSYSRDKKINYKNKIIQKRWNGYGLR